MMKLEQWGLVSLNPDPYTAPEAQPKGLHGIVSGSPHFEDGASITTSRLVKVERQDYGTLIATTARGSEYQLGEVAPAYLEAFPGGMPRILKAWGLE